MSKHYVSCGFRVKFEFSSSRFDVFDIEVHAVNDTIESRQRFTH